MSNTVKQLGFIPTNRGEYDTTGQTRYYKDNVVQYRNGSYICTPVGYSSSNLTAYTTDAPYQDGDTQLNPNWELMASVGLVDDEPTAGSENLVKSGGIYQTKNQLSLNPINEGKIISNPSAGDYITNLGVSLIQNHTYKIILTFVNSGTFSNSAAFKLMSMQSASKVAILAAIAESDITPGAYEYEFKWSEDSVTNYRAGFYAGNSNDQAIIVGVTTSIQDITLSEYAEREASIDSILNLYEELNKLSTNPPTRVGFLSIHDGKINITDSSITFPANTRVLYGESGYSYSSTQSQATTLTRDSNYEQWICFNITSKIFVARTVGSLQADDYVLFIIQNSNSTVRHNITLAPSLYTYDGKPEYAPKSSDLLTSQSYSASQKEQVLTNIGLGGIIGVDSYPKSGGTGVVKSGDLYDWMSKLSVCSYPMKYGQIESMPTAYRTYYAITGVTLTNGHKYKAKVIAGTPFTGPQYFSLKVMTSSSDSNIFTILPLADIEVSTNSTEFIWNLDSGDGFRLGFYGDAAVSTTVSVIIEDITIDTFQHENFSWDIINRNKHKETSLIATAAYSGTTNIKTANKLTLLHLSDLHGNTANLANIVLFRDHYQDYLDDTIHTGDAVQYTINNPNPFETVTGANTILNVVGNHEAWLSPSDTDYNATELQTYNKILAANISLWDVTQPTDAAENGYCYYYKDYDTAGIRLIILDSVHWHTRNGVDQSNTAQKTWFESTLEDARTNNLKVICATHYTPVNGVTLVSDTGFTDFVPSTGIVGDGWFANDEIFTCVDIFITNGGNFLGWIMGHVHNDFFGKVTGHLLQPTVIIGTSGAGSPGAESRYNKFVNETSSQDNFNVVTFETKDNKNYIKITKIGNDRNVYGRSKNSLSFNTTDWTLIYTD